MSPIITGLLVAIGVSVFVMTMAGRIGVLLAMKREDRTDHLPQRALALLAFGLGQKRMVDPEERTAGTMHVLIFAAFMVLALRTLMMFAMGFSETALALLTDLTEPFWERTRGCSSATRCTCWPRTWWRAGRCWAWPTSPGCEAA